MSGNVISMYLLQFFLLVRGCGRQSWTPSVSQSESAWHMKFPYAPSPPNKGERSVPKEEGNESGDGINLIPRNSLLITLEIIWGGKASQQFSTFFSNDKTFRPDRWAQLACDSGSVIWGFPSSRNFMPWNVSNFRRKCLQNSSHHETIIKPMFSSTHSFFTFLKFGAVAVSAGGIGPRVLHHSQSHCGFT